MEKPHNGKGADTPIVEYLYREFWATALQTKEYGAASITTWRASLFFSCNFYFIILFPLLPLWNGGIYTFFPTVMSTIYLKIQKLDLNVVWEIKAHFSKFGEWLLLENS